VKGEEGIVPDMSYHFHGEQILSSAYGLGWVMTILDSYRLTQGTAFSLPPPAQGVLARFLVEGDAALTFGRRWDWLTTGRGIDRPGTTFGWPLDAPTLLALAAEPGAAPWAAALAQFARSLGGGGPGLTGTRVFWLSDYVVHKRPTWGAAFKAYGDNGLFTVTGNEADNSENVKGEFSAAGVLNVYTSAEADHAVEAYAGIFPLWDWVRINGVTVEDRAPAPPQGDNWPVHNTAFVGGASDGESAAVAHDTALHGLTAQRAFFLFDSGVVGLLANVSCASALRVRTTLASRLLPRPASGDPRARVAVGFANGSVVADLPDGNHSWPAGAVGWVNAGGLGILPPPTLPLGVEVGNATGDYRSIGPFEGAAAGRLWTVWAEHGVAPAGAAAAYELAPNATAAGTAALAARGGGAACVVNTPALQFAAQAAAAAAGGPAGSGGLLAAVVWARGGAAAPRCDAVGAAFAVDGDGVFLLRVNATHAAATAAHPALWAAGSARRVALGKPLKAAEGCAPEGALLLTLPPAGDFMGSSVSRVCELA
jgi:chondroitin AC lyase